jgi:tetratricopeptide (TPR) repeat protein
VLDVANLYTDYNYHEKAMEWMMRAKHENTEDFKELMARTLFGLGKYDDSERIYNELIDDNPFQKRYWNALSNTQFMKEDYGASVTSSEYAIAIDPDDPESLLSKANGLFRLENYEEALVFFKRYAEHEPDDEFGLLHQGSSLLNMGNYVEATEMLKRAKEAAPEDSPYLVDIYEELAFAYSEMKMLDTALFYIGQTDTLDCNHSDINVIKGHILLANGCPSEAEQVFRQALEQSDDSMTTLLRIIVSLFDNQYNEAAYNMFHKLFAICPNDWKDGYAYMALCCYNLKRYDEFLTYLKKACEINPHETSTVISHLFPEGMKPQDYYQYIKDKMKL